MIDGMVYAAETPRKGWIDTAESNTLRVRTADLAKHFETFRKAIPPPVPPQPEPWMNRHERRKQLAKWRKRNK